MQRLRPEARAVLGRQLLELEPEDVLERRDGVRPHLLDGHRPVELARDGREHRVLEPAGGDPVGERRWIEVDVERVAVRRHPARDVDADRGDLARRPLEPDARQSFEPRRLDAERGERADQRLLEVPDVLLHVAAVPLQVEDRVADELARAVEGRLAAAVGLDHLDLRALGHVQLRGLVGAPAERHDGRVLEQDDRVGDRALRDRAREGALQLPRLEVRDLAELEEVATGRHGAQASFRTWLSSSSKESPTGSPLKRLRRSSAATSPPQASRSCRSAARRRSAARLRSTKGTRLSGCATPARNAGSGACSAMRRTSAPRISRTS